MMRYKAAIDIEPVSNQTIEILIQQLRDRDLSVIGYEDPKQDSKPHLVVATRNRPQLETFLRQYNNRFDGPVDDMISITEI